MYHACNCVCDVYMDVCRYGCCMGSIFSEIIIHSLGLIYVSSEILLWFLFKEDCLSFQLSRNIKLVQKEMGIKKDDRI